MAEKNGFLRYRTSVYLRPGSIRDKGDVVKVARVEGRKKLGVESVRVLPWGERGPDGGYVVLVEPESPPDGVVGELAEEVDAQGEDGASRRTGPRRSGTEANIGGS